MTHSYNFLDPIYFFLWTSAISFFFRTTRTYGVFLHNAAQQWVDINYKNSNGPSAHFMVESASLDLFIMMGPTPKEVVRQFGELTGKAHMPQVRNNLLFFNVGYSICLYMYIYIHTISTDWVDKRKMIFVIALKTTNQSLLILCLIS